MQQDILLCIQSCAFPIARPVWGEPINQYIGLSGFSNFNSLAPCGANPCRNVQIQEGTFHFNSLAPCGGEPSGNRHREDLLVSIRNYIALKHDYRLCPYRRRLVSIRNYIALKHTDAPLEAIPSLVSIRNYIALKHRGATVEIRGCLVSIRNYIALKQMSIEFYPDNGLVSIRNYIALKLSTASKFAIIEFSIHTKLHRSKTRSPV